MALKNLPWFILEKAPGAVDDLPRGQVEQFAAYAGARAVRRRQPKPILLIRKTHPATGTPQGPFTLLPPARGEEWRIGHRKAYARNGSGTAGSRRRDPPPGRDVPWTFAARATPTGAAMTFQSENARKILHANGELSWISRKPIGSGRRRRCLSPRAERTDDAALLNQRIRPNRRTDIPLPSSGRYLSRKRRSAISSTA